MIRLLLPLLFAFLLLFSSNAFASITAEQAYDIARMEMLSTDFNLPIKCSIIRNETPWNFNRNTRRLQYEHGQIENKLKGKEYWAIDFLIGETGKHFQFFVDSSNGKILASYPSHEEILKYYSRGKGLISMDAAIATADKEIIKRNIEFRKAALKIDKETLGHVYENYSAARPKISNLLPKEKYRSVWEIDYWMRGTNSDVIVLIDAETGDLLDFIQ